MKASQEAQGDSCPLPRVFAKQSSPGQGRTWAVSVCPFPVDGHILDRPKSGPKLAQISQILCIFNRSTDPVWGLYRVKLVQIITPPDLCGTLQCAQHFLGHELELSRQP